MSDEIKELKKQLFSTKKNGYDKLDAAELSAMEAYCDRYKAFLDAGKTERRRRGTGPMSGAWPSTLATRCTSATGASL